MATNPFNNSGPAQGSYKFVSPGQPAAPATSPANPFQGPTGSGQGGPFGDMSTLTSIPEAVNRSLEYFGNLQDQPTSYVGTTPQDYRSSSTPTPAPPGTPLHKGTASEPGVEPLQIDPYVPAEWPIEARESVLDLLEERMDPNFSMWSPEARAAADRRVGSMLAISERDIGAGMAGRGLGNSGIRDQLMRDANVKAAVGMGDISAQFSEADALQRFDAARQLEDMRRWSSVADWDQYVQYAGVGPMYAGEIGDRIAEGADMETFDYAQYGATAEGYEQWREALDAMIEEGKMGFDDLFLAAVQTFIKIPGVG